MANTEIGSAYLSVYARMDKGFSSEVITKATAMGSTIANVFSKAMGVVGDSIGDAVKRTDIIQNYPKVMESIGFSSDAAAASIKKIQAGVQGLPTSTASLVSFVQQLAATSGDLGKATDMGVAFNDMMLAGGAGTTAASNACEQYSQMLAAGKVDQQAWNSVVAAAPGQIAMVARTLLGANANQKDLYQALKDGTISMDDFNDAIVRLDQQGGDGFASFHDQAVAATAGIGTAVENVRNRIVNALTKVIQAIGPESIAGAINGVSSQFGSIADVAVEFIRGMQAVFLDSGLSETVGHIADDFAKWLPPIDEVKAAAAEMGRSVGTELSDLAGAVYDSGIADSLGELVSTVGDAAAKVVGSLGDLAGSVDLEPLISGVRDAIDGVTPIVEALGDALSEAFSSQAVKDGLQGIVDAIHDLSPLIGPVLGALLAFRAIGPVVSVVTSLGTAFKTVSTVIKAAGMVKSFAGLGAVISTVAGGPMVLIVGAIALVVGALVGLYATNEDFRNKVNAIWGGIVSFFSGIPGAIEGFFSGVAAFFGGVFQGAADAVHGAWDGVTGFFSGMWDSISSTAQAVWNGILSFLTAVWQGIQVVFTTYLNIITAVVTTVFNALVTIVSVPVDLIAALITAAWTGISSVTTTVWNAVSGFLSGLWNGLSSAASSAFSAIRTVVTNIWQGISSTTSSIWNGVRSTLSGIWNGIRSTASSVFNGVKDAITRPIQAAKDAVTRIASGIGSALSNIHFSIPHIKLPHLSVKGSFSINPPSVPSFGVDWYRRGMGAFDTPTIIGVGDAPETEYVLRRSQLMAVADEASRRASSGLDASAAVVAWLDRNLGPTIERYAPEATPREFGRMARRYS